MSEEDATEAEPAILCPRCGERVPLRGGHGSPGAKVFTCANCGHEFTGPEAESGGD
jgi:DNA-directed RNA polymerase subunit RPC12/RpoP